jgi:hypothetical protein
MLDKAGGFVESGSGMVYSLALVRLRIGSSLNDASLKIKKISGGLSTLAGAAMKKALSRCRFSSGESGG